MNNQAEKVIRELFGIYGKAKIWADALISDWEYYFNWAGISDEGEAQFDCFFEHCKTQTDAGKLVSLDPPRSRPIGE